MYKRHKWLIRSIFFISLVLSYWFNADYNKIAEPAINVTAIAIGIYTAAVSSILGSDYSRRLASITSREFKCKTLLGVLYEYLYWAGMLSLSSIILSVLFLSDMIPIEGTLRKLLSAVSYGIFLVNLILFGLIFMFLIRSLNKAMR